MDRIIVGTYEWILETEPSCDRCGAHPESVTWCGSCGSCAAHCEGFYDCPNTPTVLVADGPYPC